MSNIEESLFDFTTSLYKNTVNKLNLFAPLVFQDTT